MRSILTPERIRISNILNFVLSRFWQEWSSPQALASTGSSATRSADVCSLWNLPTKWTSSNDCGRGRITGSYAASDRGTETYCLMTCATFGVCISRRSFLFYLWPVTFLRAFWCTAIFSLGPNNGTLTISMPLFPLKRRCSLWKEVFCILLYNSLT